MAYLARQSGSFYPMTRDEVEAKLLVRTLDPAERRLLRGLTGGKSLRTIAETIGIAESQAEALKSNMLRKFGMRTTADLVRVGLCAGLA